MSRIIVSLPSNPMEYFSHKYSWSQNCCFIYNSIANYFGKDKVMFVPYNMMHSFDFKTTDVLVSTLAYLPAKGEKIILIGGGSFENSKWFHGSYMKYGYNVNFMGPTYHFQEQIKRCSAFLVQTNDVSIDKWNNNHEDVSECKKWYVDNNINIKLMQHPIDKAYYGSLYRERTYNKIKMLVYWGGMPKDATKIVETLQHLGYKEGVDYTIFKNINTEHSSMINLLNEYAVMSHTSYLEGFPYLINEFMTAGMLPFCTDEWWNGYGYDRLLWSYNPKLQERNVENLRFLFDPNNLQMILDVKRDVWKKHYNRQDNTWDYYDYYLIKEIEKCL